MPRLITAQLLNHRGRVTLHVCNRLEKRGHGRQRAIYPIFICAETGEERSFGFLCATTGVRVLAQLYPHIPLVIPDPAEDGGERAA